MKYTKEEAFEEAMKRGRKLKIRKAKRSAAALTAHFCSLLNRAVTFSQQS